ncbi:MAG: hypothetical protein M3447_04545 [Acidobacteriota bacterium]|nr:hypothetical protein [Acidobacteriota bacterium]
MNAVCINLWKVLQAAVRPPHVVLGLLFILSVSFPSKAQDVVERIAVAGSNEQWYAEGKERASDARVAEFLGRQALWLKNGTQVMRSDLEFVDGTIEFDFAPMTNGNFLGVIFRRVSFGNHENIYLRLHRSGLYNAIQYAPRMNFSPTWQLYPEFNAVADFPRNQWTHVRIEVSATSMEMYVDNQEKPVLVVARLRGVTDKGAVSFWGRVNDKPAEWAVAVSNVSIRPANSSKTGTSGRPGPPAGTLTSWKLAGPVKTEGAEITSLPELKDWQAVATEESGLVNINRALRRTPGRSTAFARTTLPASDARLVLLEIGYSDDVTVFLNGEPVYRGINGFDSRHPEYMGFVKPEFENLYLRLRPGNNDLVLAVTDDQRFGWGFIARLKEKK